MVFSRPRSRPLKASPAAIAPTVERLEDRHLLSAVGGGSTIDVGPLEVDQAEHASTHIIVRFKEGVTPPPGLRGEELMRGSNIWQVMLGQGQSVAEAVAAFARRADVHYAQPDYTVRIQTVLHPTDELYGYANNNLWGLNNVGLQNGQISGTVDADIDAPEAWYQVAAALNGRVGSMATAVAVIDSGLDYRHPDLYLNIWINQGEIPHQIRSLLTDVDGDGLITFRDLNHESNSRYVVDANGDGRIDGSDLLRTFTTIVDAQGLRVTGGWLTGQDGDGNGYRDDLFGWDFHNNDNDPLDDQSHGTHVAGTIGAIANNDRASDGSRGNLAQGVVGVAWEVSLMGLKFLSASGSGATSNAIRALDYAVRMGAKVSNNSWGGAPYEQALADAIQRAALQGHLFVAAAGNGDFLGRAKNNDSSPHYPSNYLPTVDTVLAVTATDNNDRMASFSNYGATTVDLAAPGVGIWSTIPLNLDTADGSLDGLRRLNGTSMAAPHVTGAAALIWAIAPNLTALQVKQLLMRTVDPIGHIGTNASRPTVTNGRLNLDQAIREALVLRHDTAAPDVPAELTAQVSSSQVILNWRGDATGNVAAYLVYRSDNGGPFALVAAITPPGFSGTQHFGGATVSFTDTSAPVGVSYVYAVVAVDRASNESTAAEVEVTIVAPPQPSLYVSRLQGTSIVAKKPGTWEATATVEILDDAGNPVTKGATVYGEWISASGAVLASVNTSRNSKGLYSFTRTGLSTANDPNVVFRVTNVIHATLAYHSPTPPPEITILRPIGASSQTSGSGSPAVPGTLTARPIAGESDDERLPIAVPVKADSAATEDEPVIFESGSRSLTTEEPLFADLGDLLEELLTT